MNPLLIGAAAVAAAALLYLTRPAAGAQANPQGGEPVYPQSDQGSGSGAGGAAFSPLPFSSLSGGSSSSAAAAGAAPDAGSSLGLVDTGSTSTATVPSSSTPTPIGVTDAGATVYSQPSDYSQPPSPSNPYPYGGWQPATTTGNVSGVTAAPDYVSLAQPTPVVGGAPTTGVAAQTSYQQAHIQRIGA